MNPHNVRVGQVWEDNDWRGYGRKVRVLAIDGRHAIVGAGVNGDGRRARIRLDRFRPTSTGYKLWKESR